MRVFSTGFNSSFFGKQRRNIGMLHIKTGSKNNAIFLFSIIIVFTLFHRFLIQCGLSAVSKYLLDAINVLMLMIVGIRGRFHKNLFVFHFLIFLCVILFGTIPVITHLGGWRVTAVNYILDIRSILRPFVFLLVCVSTLDYKTIEKTKSFLIIYHLINSVYIVYQYFTLEVVKFWMRGDNLNGFFGIDTGGNIFVNVVEVLTTLIVFERYKEKKYNKGFTLFLTVVNVIIATLIELKMFYIELVVIIMFFFFDTKKLKKLSSKKILGLIFLTSIGAVFIRFMILFMYKLYPSMMGSLSIEGMLSMTAESGYTGSRDLNRLSFIQGINNYIFHGDIFKNILGQGIGSATTNSDFNAAYDSTHYTWFSSAYLYIETGMIGLVLYLISIIGLVKLSTTSKRKYLICSVVLTLIMIVYNETMKTEACYLVAFNLACGFKSNTHSEIFIDKNYVIRSY